MDKKSILLIVVTLFSVHLFSQSTNEIKLVRKLSILNDRAFCNFPNDAEISKYATVHQNLETEIHFELTVKYERMPCMFVARELFKVADNSIVENISKELESSNNKFITKLLSKNDSATLIISTPTVFDLNQHSVLTNILFVKTPDNTVFAIYAYCDPTDLNLKDQFQTLSEKVFATLTLGPRINNRKTRQEDIAIFRTDKKFKISLPDDYSLTVDSNLNKYCLIFHRFQNWTDTTNQTRLFITIHSDQNTTYEDFELKGKLEEVDGKFLNRKIKWLLFERNKSGLLKKKQKIACDFIQSGFVIDVYMSSDEQKYLDQLTKIVESIEIKE